MVHAWGLSNATLRGFGINRPVGATGSDGQQAAPALASNDGEAIGIAWLTGATPRIAARFLDALGQPDPLFPGTVLLDDGAGNIVSGPAIGGIGAGYAAIWSEQAQAGSPSTVNPALLHGRLTGATALFGPEFTVAPADPEGLPVIRQYAASVAGWEIPTAGGVAAGFSVAWTADVALPTGGSESRIMLQRFAVPGSPGAPSAVGLDGVAGTADDAPLLLGHGRDAHLATLDDGEQFVVWVGEDGSVQARLFHADGSVASGLDFSDLGTLGNGQIVRAVAMADGGFGIFRVLADAETGQPLLVGTIWHPGGAPGSWVRDDDQVVAELPFGFTGAFHVTGLEGPGLGGVALWNDANGQVFLRAFGPDAVPLPETPLPSPLAGAYPVGEPGKVQTDAVLAGLIGNRVISVWQEPAADGDIRAQMLDIRGAAQLLIGDRERPDGRIDARADFVVGAIGNDTIVADRGDTDQGEQAEDTVVASLGDDVVYGGGGDDFLDGGTQRVGDNPAAPSDIDTAVFRGDKRQYSITTNGDGTFTVKDMRGGVAGGPDGQDTIVGFERLAFGATLEGTELVLPPATKLVSMGLFFAPPPGTTPIRGPAGGTGADTLSGSNRADVIDGGRDADHLSGGAGPDLLIGGSHADTLEGEAGSDTLVGGSENDLLLGGDLPDLLIGGFGADTLDGGNGIDAVSYQGEFASFHIDLAAGRTLSDRNPATGAPLTDASGAPRFVQEDVLVSVESAIGGEAADSILGSAGANRLEGRGGDDTLDGGAGRDTAVFSGPLADYAVQAATGGLTVEHRRGQITDGRDTLRSIEVLEFGALRITAAEAQPGARLATVFTAESGVVAPVFSLSDPRFQLVTEPGGDIALYLRPGVALDAETASALDLALTGTLPNGVTVTQPVQIAVTDVNEPITILPGGIVSGTVVEDSAPNPQAGGQFRFDDPDAGQTHQAQVTRGTVTASDPATGEAPIGTLRAVVTAEPGASGPGRVEWRFEVDNGALQRLGEGDTLTQTFTIKVAEGAEEILSAPGGYPADQVMVALAGGGYVIVWTELRDDSSAAGIWARVFDSEGRPIGDTFRVNAEMPDFGVSDPAVTALDGGGFVVAWCSASDNPGPDGTGYSSGIAMQAFAANGVRLGNEIWVNVETEGDQVAPNVIALEGDRCVVTWRSRDPDAEFGGEFVAGRVFALENLALVPLTGELQLTPDEPPGQENVVPSVEAYGTVALAGGGFVHGWVWTEAESGFIGVMYQTFAADGTPIGTPRSANVDDSGAFSAGAASAIAVTALENGGFVLAWKTVDPDLPLAARIFTADGTPAGSYILPATGGQPAEIRLLSLEGGGFVLAWWDADALRIRGQTFSADGATIGAGFAADLIAPGPASQTDPRLARTPDGGFVLAWTAENGVNGLDIFIQAFGPDGAARGPAKPLNLKQADTQFDAVLTALANGDIAASWISFANGEPALVGRVLPPDGGSVAEQTVTVTITGVNDRPVAQDIIANPVIFIEEAGVGVASSAALAGDLRFANRISDPDAGESELLRVIAGGRAGTPTQPLTFDQSGEAVIQGLYGTLHIDQFGHYHYELDNDRAATNALAEGAIVEEVFDYVVANGPNADDRAGATIRFRILGTNDRPTATPEEAVLALDAPASGVSSPPSVAGTLADNVGDVDFGAAKPLILRAAAGTAAPTLLSFDATTGEAAIRGTYGTLYLKADGAWRYALDPADPDTQALPRGQEVTDVFSYAASNGSGAGDISLPSTLTVRIVTPPPVSVVASRLSVPIAAGDFLTTIGPDDLDAVSPLPGNPPLVWTVASAPKGRLLLNGVEIGPGATFTDADLAAGHLLYVPGPLRPATPVSTPGGRISAAGILLTDSFQLLVNDGAGAMPLTLELPWQSYDTIQTAPVAAMYVGASLNDWQIGTGAAERMFGRQGDDLLIGGNGADSIYGEAGNDRLFGEGGFDYIAGGFGDDVLDGGVGGDTLRGDDGNDLIFGGTGPGNDLLIGNAGADTLFGEDGNDRLFGGTGNDLLMGGAGVDRLRGEAADDTLNGGTGGDDLRGDDGNDLIYGGAGVFADALFGLAGADTLLGEDGDDRLFGGTDNDLLMGGAGRDRLRGEAGADTLNGGLGNDDLRGDDGDDLIFGGAGVHYDALFGLAGADTLLGEDGDDRLFGGTGDDLLLGGAGKDVLRGEAGADTLNGGSDADLLIGGAGADVFLYESLTPGVDRIQDFVSGIDRLAFSATGFGADLVAGMDLAATGRFVVAANGQGTIAGLGQFVWMQALGVLTWDADGAGGAAAQRIATFDAGTTLNASDLQIIA